jgi:uncharacterized protein (DUF488 family)
VLETGRTRRSIKKSSVLWRAQRGYTWRKENEGQPREWKFATPITVDGLLDLLLRASMRRLIDVRCNPIARRYGFHKESLRRLCADVDIEYLHMAALGVPSAWRADLSDTASYTRLFERYDNEILPAQQMVVDKAGALISEMPSALMCMEANHHCCHRSRLGAEIARRTSLPVKELREM